MQYNRRSHTQCSMLDDQYERERVFTNKIAYSLYAGLMPQRQAITMIIIYCSKPLQNDAVTPTPLAHLSRTCMCALALGHDTTIMDQPSKITFVTTGRNVPRYFNARDIITTAATRFGQLHVLPPLACEHITKVFAVAWGRLLSEIADSGISEVAKDKAANEVMRCAEAAFRTAIGQRLPFTHEGGTIDRMVYTKAVTLTQMAIMGLIDNPALRTIPGAIPPNATARVRETIPARAAAKIAVAAAEVKRATATTASTTPAIPGVALGVVRRTPG